VAESINKRKRGRTPEYRARQRARSAARAARGRERLWTLKENLTCVDCAAEGRGWTWPSEILHFDHRLGVVKVSSVANMKTSSDAAFEAEVAKCDPVCPNHHAIRTLKARRDGVQRGGGSRLEDRDRPGRYRRGRRTMNGTVVPLGLEHVEELLP
jgi:hypothetical protein